MKTLSLFISVLTDALITKTEEDFQKEVEDNFENFKGSLDIYHGLRQLNLNAFYGGVEKTKFISCLSFLYEKLGFTGNDIIIFLETSYKIGEIKRKFPNENIDELKRLIKTICDLEIEGLLIKNYLEELLELYLNDHKNISKNLTDIKKYSDKLRKI